MRNKNKLGLFVFALIFNLIGYYTAPAAQLIVKPLSETV